MEELDMDLVDMGQELVTDQVEAIAQDQELDMEQVQDQYLSNIFFFLEFN